MKDKPKLQSSAYITVPVDFEDDPFFENLRKKGFCQVSELLLQSVNLFHENRVCKQEISCQSQQRKRPSCPKKSFKTN